MRFPFSLMQETFWNRPSWDNAEYTNLTVAKLFLSVYFLLRMYYYSFYKQWVIRGEKMIDL